MTQDKIFKHTVQAYVVALSDEKVGALINVLSADSEAPDLTPMILAHGQRIALIQAMIYAARAEQKRAKGCLISMQEYLQSKHLWLPEAKIDPKVAAFALILSELELDFAIDVRGDAAKYLTALVWSVQFVARTNARISTH